MKLIRGCAKETDATVVAKDVFASFVTINFADIEESDIQFESATLVWPNLERKLLE
jgi:MoxR-like ATPase